MFRYATVSARMLTIVIETSTLMNNSHVASCINSVPSLRGSKLVNALQSLLW